MCTCKNGYTGKKVHCIDLKNCFLFVFWFLVFNATFDNISVVLWRSVLFLEETGGPGENHLS
jgi:hypothetical protein